MNKRKGSMVLLSSLLAVSLSLVISSPLAMVWASSNGDDFREIKKADIGIKGDVIKTIFFKTRGEIPTDGSGGAFGYGVVTSDNKAIVTTTHAGVLDSKLQNGEILNPIWHNHYVQLADETECESGLKVGDLTYESPGKVIVKDSFALLKNLPPSEDGQFTNTPITPGSEVSIVASFKLVPLLDLTVFQTNPDANPLVAVCVEDIRDVEDPRDINIFDIKNHYGYGSEEYYPSSYEDKHDYRGEYHEKDYRNNYDYNNGYRR